MEKPDHRHRWLLRVCGERPSYRAAEKLDELSAFHAIKITPDGDTKDHALVEPGKQYHAQIPGSSTYFTFQVQRGAGASASLARQDDVLQDRKDLVLPGFPAEHAIVADAGLHVMAFH